MVRLPGEGVFLVSEDEARILQGALYEGLVPLLDGRSRQGIVDSLAGDFPRAHIHYALLRLEEGGYLAEGRDGDGDTDEAWPRVDGMDLELPGTDGAEPSEPLGAAGNGAAGRPLALLALGAASETVLERARGVLEEAGFCFAGTGTAGTPVVLADDYLHPGLEEVDREARSTGMPWILARVVGRRPRVGPFFHPGEGPCWHCMAHRLRQNRPVERYLAERSGSVGPLSIPRPVNPLALESALSVLQGGLLSWASSGESLSLRETLLAPAPSTGRAWRAPGSGPVHEPRRHHVPRRPQCPACGDPRMYSRRVATPPKLDRAPKVFTADGGHRTLPPEETVRLRQKLVDPLTGVVTELRRQDGIPDPSGLFHLFVAGDNVARYDAPVDRFRRDLRSWSGGKGKSEAQARASALGEAIERHSGVFQGDEPRRTGTLTELGSDAIHPNDCMLYSERQYAERKRWNAGGGWLRYVPPPFDPDASLEWSPVWSLTHGTRRWLPTMYLYYNAPVPNPAQVFCRADSNGCASGNTLEEAVLQGFLELAERDAVAMWWYTRARRPGVDISGCPDPWPARLTERYRELGREFWVLDLTNDLAIPTFAAVTRKVEGPREEILLGLGAHLDPVAALNRSLTEMNQMLANRFGAGADTGDGDDPELRSWLRDATVAREPYLAPAPGVAIDFAGIRRTDTADLRDDVELCRRRVEERGMDFLVLDQTRPDVDVPVVKVLVPGLRFFRPRFRSGRLYDVPPMMSWLDTRPSEPDLNPIPFFL